MEFSGEFITGDITVKQEVIKRELANFFEDDKTEDEFLLDPLADLESGNTLDIPSVESQPVVEQVILVKYDRQKVQPKLRIQPHSEPTKRRKKYSGNYKCHSCGKKLSNMFSLQRHRLNKHSAKKLLANSNPSKSESGHSKLQKKNAGNYQCQVCGKKLSNMFCLQRHRLNKHIAKNSKSESGISKLQKNKHYVKIPRVTSRQKYKPKSRLTKPRKMNAGIYQCQICGKNLSTPYSLQRHHQRKHRSKNLLLNSAQIRNIPLSFKCFICSKVFATESSLKSHQATHSRDRDHLPVNLLFEKIASGVILEKRPSVSEKTIQINTKNVSKPVISKSVNVNDAKEVAKVLGYKTVKVSLLRWYFPPGMFKRYRGELGTTEDLCMDLD